MGPSSISWGSQLWQFRGKQPGECCASHKALPILMCAISTNPYKMVCSSSNRIADVESASIFRGRFRMTGSLFAITIFRLEEGKLPWWGDRTSPLLSSLSLSASCPAHLSLSLGQRGHSQTSCSCSRRESGWTLLLILLTGRYQ